MKRPTSRDSDPTLSFDARLHSGTRRALSDLEVGDALADGRFSIEERLGEGGMGVVFRALDRRTDTRVALKTLSSEEAESISLLKAEFRAIADVVHPNLVGLHELFSDGGRWFFTMDLVDGVPFIEHVRTDFVRAEDETLLSPGAEETGDAGPLLEAPGTFRTDALHNALRQLAVGVAAIHAAGKLHRDLKPSNVLVRSDGRVMILDFGLARDRQRAPEQLDLSGTPAYMAPEQVYGESSTASDWYAVGVMLYEALTGALPFTGDFRRVLLAKLENEAPRPSASASGVPHALDALCIDLLRREPEARPDGPEVLRRLAARDSVAPVASVRTGEEAFFGRVEELSSLEGAFEAVRRGRITTVLCHGPSGMGKSTIVERFLRNRQDLQDACVLAGRCYEREAVPFKALDGVLDALSRALSDLGDDRVAALVPPDIDALLKIFPILRRVPLLAGRPDTCTTPEPLAERLRAFAALKSLLRSLARDVATVVFIDDLQWGDVDGARLLSELLEPDESAPLLFVLAYRSDEARLSPCLSTLLDDHRGIWRARAIELGVGPLPAADVANLAASLVGADRADALLRQAEGSPYLVTELARVVQDRKEEGPLDRHAISAAIVRRARRLGGAPERLLEVVCVAGRPMPTDVALDSAGLAGNQRATLTALATAHLVRATTISGRPALSPYHERVREAVLAVMTGAERLERHSALAAALSQAADPNPEMLVEHLAAAGHEQQALERALEAAAEAGAVFAFQAQADLYRRALPWVQTEQSRHSVRLLLADALGKAGRPSEAAWVLLEDTQESPVHGEGGEERASLRLRAADHLLLAGHLEEGMSLLDEALRAEGLALPPAGVTLDPSFFELVMKLNSRGLAFSRVAEASVEAERLRRIDLFWSVGWGLHLSSYRGRPYLLRHLLEALDAGEPYRIVRGLALYLQVLSALGAPNAEAVRQALVAAANGSSDPRVIFWLEYAHAGFHRYFGRAVSACEHGARADAALGLLPAIASRDLGALRASRSTHMHSAGQYRDFIRFTAEWLADAESRHDLFASIWMNGYLSQRALLLDDPTAALARLRGALARWRRPESDDLLHSMSVLQELAIHQYAGNAPGMAALLDGTSLPANLAGLPYFAAMDAQVRGRAALTLSEATGDVAQRLDQVLEAADRIERAAPPTEMPLAYSLRAGVAERRGEAVEGRRLLDAAIASARDPESAAWRDPLERVDATLRGDRSLVAILDERMQRQGIVNPGRFTAACVPAFGSAPSPERGLQNAQDQLAAVSDELE